MDFSTGRGRRTDRQTRRPAPVVGSTEPFLSLKALLAGPIMTGMAGLGRPSVECVEAEGELFMESHETGTAERSAEREGVDLSRRAFIGGTGAALVVTATAPAALAAGTPAVALEQTTSAARSVPRTAISLTVNGAVRRVEVEDRWTLADLLRDQLQLTGTKLGCERGECGACTVLLDDKPVYACSQLAVWMDGRSVVTVEGLAINGQLHPLQQAFIEHDAPQCGFCTSGQLMSAKALLDRNPHPSPDDVRHALVGNLCRCSNYNRYVEAILAVAAGRTAPLDGRQRTGGAQ